MMFFARSQSWFVAGRSARAALRVGFALASSWLLLLLHPSHAAAEAPTNAPAVTVFKAVRFCFSDIIDVFGTLAPREEIAVRPDRPGLKVAEALAEPGQTVTMHQALVRLRSPDGSSVTIQSPAAGVVSASSAVVGAIASGKGEPLFSIITGNEFDLVGQAPARDLLRLKVDQSATVRVIGAGNIEGKVRRIAATVEPDTQLGRVFVSVAASKFLPVNSPGRASIKAGESCGVSAPLSAILYNDAGAVIQVVRHQRVETRRVETGLIAEGRAEIREGLSEGELVVARAGALLREGDPVRPMSADPGAD